MYLEKCIERRELLDYIITTWVPSTTVDLTGQAKTSLRNLIKFAHLGKIHQAEDKT